MPLPLLQTKLYLPPPRPRLVHRAQLSAQLRANAACPLILVSAPAGFGKTTLISEWIYERAALAGAPWARSSESQTTPHAAFPTPNSVAWLSLDEDDNEPIRFLSYLIAALHTQHPTLGEATMPLLDTLQPAPPKAILTQLINELGTLLTPLVLVLDDYHVITAPAIHEALTFLIDHLPPNLHLILTTRADPPLPLSRWRVRRQMLEIRAADLRFSAAEATIFLNEIMGLPLKLEEIAKLESRTEGWIAGLQLAGLAIQGTLATQGRQGAQGFVVAFAGSNRFIVDYLLEEVLQQQSSTTLDFLLQTSILSQMTAALCNALTGRSDGQRQLALLEQANLFLIALDDQRHWYRYHHLFAEVLRNRLQLAQPTLVHELHSRASRWYEQEQMIDAAIHHAQAAGDVERSATLVEQHAMTRLEREEVLVVRAWLSALPSSLIQARLLLTLIEGTVLVLTGQLDGADRFFATTENRFIDPACPRPLYGVWSQLRALQARYRGEISNIIEYTQEALEALPPTLAGARAHAWINLGLAQTMIGDTGAARRAFLTAAEEGRSIQSFTAYSALISLGWLQTRLGELTQASQTYRQVIEQTARLPGRTAPFVGMAYVGLAETLYERNECEAARQAALRGIEHLRGSVEQVLLAVGYGILAQLSLAEGDADKALATLEEAESWLTQMQMNDMGFRHALAASRVLVWLQQGNLNGAQQWAASTSQRRDPNPFSIRHWENLTLLRVWLATGKGARALALIDEMLATARSRQWTESLIKLSALRALACQQQGDRSAAAALLRHALTLAQPEGFIRTFVDLGAAMRLLILDLRVMGLDVGEKTYVARLLTAFEEEQPTNQDHAENTTIHNPQSKTQNLIEPLSERELEILRLVNAGLSNSEIADKIIVTVGTVKKHLNNIFGKLGAGSRTQAIVRAREVGLL